jgi:hypothetical protein
MTLNDAEGVLQLARNWYKKPDALKSNNKWYAFDTGQEAKAIDTLAKARNVTSEVARAKVERRSASLLAERPKRLPDEARMLLTPVEYGAMLVNSNQTSGNCGEMAVVAMYFASMGPCEPKNMALVTARNKFSWRGMFDQMKFGHSWALLGADGSSQFVVDPWAGVACAKDDYKEQFTAKMNKWQQQGKRVLVNYESGNGWYCANDSNILSLFSAVATVHLDRGDAKFKS